ncbi:hypothetical protein QE197_19570 (plasmid) [Arsenophonus nasoniae]|uniref:Chaperone protein SigE n=1 Tax=Arsenophonus nasoniae TaxID=638 RepID=A0A4P7L3N1_9GAMM|nr:hypothetical protein [Arsenophonus nasoniae]QBY45700.1 Chaperone protein SigE [Arsenophonus nasoniae]WGM07956.1 hypothetical protein QE258_22120 [Arsenophonus nasoniae]WGM12897.1 hypothetical protein QE197_19570 [Arsenophonus nasoniae]WGM17602.1 hypothetical protein QE193_19760 [Arsenophonus nasoniae]
MQKLLSFLYDYFGLELDNEEPVLSINNDLSIYFDRSNGVIEMICPLMRATNDPELLIQILKINYYSNVILSTDLDASVILAIYRIPGESSESDMLSALELIINFSIKFQQDFLYDKKPVLKNEISDKKYLFNTKKI